MSKQKIEIKTSGGTVLFSFETEDNTVRKTLEEAVQQKVTLCRADLEGADLEGADLGRAYLRGADLEGADLRGADLRGAKNIPKVWVNREGAEYMFDFVEDVRPRKDGLGQIIVCKLRPVERDYAVTRIEQ